MIILVIITKILYLVVGGYSIKPREKVWIVPTPDPYYPLIDEIKEDQ